jgi:hypothetical protein
MTPEEQHRAPERLRRLGKTPQLIAGEHCSVPQLGSDKPLLERIKEKNLTSFIAAKEQLGLKPITVVEGTLQFIASNFPQGNFTLVDLPWVNHGSKVLLRDTPERRKIRQWLQEMARDAQNDS